MLSTALTLAVLRGCCIFYKKTMFFFLSPLIDNGKATFASRFSLERAILRIREPRYLRNLAEMQTQGLHLTSAPAEFSHSADWRYGLPFGNFRV